MSAKLKLGQRKAKNDVCRQLLQTVIENFSDKVGSPIFVIRSYAQLLQRTQDKAVLERGLVQLDSASLKLDKVIASLCDLLSIYSKDTPENDLVFFKEAFENVQSDFDKEIEASQVKFEVNFSDCPNVWFPVSYLRDVFLRLISNSLIHNADQENLVITISSCKILNSTVLEIKDNGKGVDLVPLKERCSQPFNNQSKDEANVGVGLSIVEAIAKVTESVYELESTMGEGTTCRFYFRQ